MLYTLLNTDPKELDPKMKKVFCEMNYKYVTFSLIVMSYLLKLDLMVWTLDTLVDDKLNYSIILFNVLVKVIEKKHETVIYDILIPRLEVVPALFIENERIRGSDLLTIMKLCMMYKNFVTFAHLVRVFPENMFSSPASNKNRKKFPYSVLT